VVIGVVESHLEILDLGLGLFGAFPFDGEGLDEAEGEDGDEGVAEVGGDADFGEAVAVAVEGADVFLVPAPEEDPDGAFLEIGGGGSGGVGDVAAHPGFARVDGGGPDAGAGDSYGGARRQREREEERRVKRD
jgi:hypothetical protein